MNNLMQTLLNQFNIDGEFSDFKYFTSGHINTTALVTFYNGTEKDLYVLQKINKTVFNNPSDVMENIINTTTFIKNKLETDGKNPNRRVLEFLKANDGNYYTIDNFGDYWRMYKFIDHSITFDATTDLKVLEETGKAFGEFQHLLDGFDANKLNIIIPHFHNTVNRYEIFNNVVKNNPQNRVASTINEINEYVKLREIATKMYKMQQCGQLPLRVTHNDTKCNNVLFDSDSNQYLCVIDLDTIMPGLVGFDFGDAVRFASNTSAEDEQDLSKVKIDLAKYEAIAKGFLATAGNSLTRNEKETLSLGAITMTIECGLRFLTDYLDGDNYFKISYPEHNLHRAKCQLKLAQDMLAHYQEMQDTIHNCLEETGEKE